MGAGVYLDRGGQAHKAGCMIRPVQEHAWLTRVDDHQHTAEHGLCMQVWEQEFAWTERDKPIKLAARALTVPNDHELNRQPIFCFETMMHMLYWSCLVYDHKRVSLVYTTCAAGPSLER